MKWYRPQQTGHTSCSPFHEVVQATVDRATRHSRKPRNSKASRHLWTGPVCEIRATPLDDVAWLRQSQAMRAAKIGHALSRVLKWGHSQSQHRQESARAYTTADHAQLSDTAVARLADLYLDR